MNNTNLAYANSEYIWNLPEWDYFVNEITKVFGLTKEEKEKFENSNTAKIIATIPFEAGCNEPERTAIAHLCIYMAEIRGFQKHFAHLPSDDFDIYNRLAFISTFDGGDKNIIKHGMDILAYIMIEGYKKSEAEDLQNNIYNPFVSGNWDYKELKNHILLEVNKMYVSNLDWIFSDGPIDRW